MADTYGRVWRIAQLHCPSAPTLLVQSWVRRVYQRVISARDQWSWLRRETELRFPAQQTRVIEATQGSATLLTTVALGEDAIGQQIRLLGQPLYTILAVDGLAVTLDRPWGLDAMNGADALIYRAYVTMPAGFTRWLTLTDLESKQPVIVSTTERELAAWDPARQQLGGWPLHLASYRRDATGLTQYEAWPHLTSARVLSGIYLVGAPDELDDDETLPEGLPTDLLLTGTLAEAAAWPGTVTERNPYFNLTLSAQHRGQFEQDLTDAIVEDEERYPTFWVTPELRGGRFPAMAYDDGGWG